MSSKIIETLKTQLMCNIKYMKIYLYILNYYFYMSLTKLAYLVVNKKQKIKWAKTWAIL